MEGDGWVQAALLDLDEALGELADLDPDAVAPADVWALRAGRRTETVPLPEPGELARLLAAGGRRG